MRLPSAEGIDLAAALEQQIVACTDRGKLCELLDTQAQTAEPSAALDLYLRRFIDQPIPFVTAKVFKVYRDTGCGDAEIHRAAAAYLRLHLYRGEWYDETIISIGWATEQLAEGKSSDLTAAYAVFLSEAEQEGDEDLLDFCRQMQLYSS